MNDNLSNNAIDEKMARMRLKNLEILKRHQEIEQDRQLAVQTGATMKTSRSRLHPPTNVKTDNFQERIYRAPFRRKFENETSSQRVQRVDYNRLKREHAQEPITNSIRPQLQDYTFHNQSETTTQDTDGPTQAKKLVIINNKAERIGSGRFNQQQRTQDKAQRKREERMRRSTVPTGGTNEFHLDISPVPMWQNGPMHVQLIPANHTGIDHLINTTTNDQIDQPQYIPNFVYPTASPATPFNNNGTIYFAQPAQTHFHQYHPNRTFENSTRHQYHLPSFQTSPIFPPPPPPVLHSLPTPPNENPPSDTPIRFRRLKTPEYENKSRPMSNETERLHNTYQPSTPTRFQQRPQTFYDFSSNTNSNNNNNSNNFFRSQRNPNPNNASLPLSAYIDTDNSDNHRISRRKTQPRSYHYDKHQFPLSSYDIDAIEEWWEDKEADLTGGTKSNSGAIDDSGTGSLSTSVNLNETTNPSSNVSTTDSNIIESLDKLQQELKFEEAVDQRLASNETAKELIQYDTAHFMQWAKEKFREELAVRLTAQQIEQHDAVTTEDDDNPSNNLDNLEDDLHDKLIIEGNK